MVNYNRENMQSLRNIEGHAQSAAIGTWVGAGFQAAAAFQASRAAAAQEEQLALQHKMAEQTRNHQFAMWRQTPDGVAYLQWQQNAVQLAQLLRTRDSEWQQGWARAIGRAQAGVAQDEIQRFVNYPARLKQAGLKLMSILAFVAAGIAGIAVLFNLLATSVAASVDTGGAFTYEDCLKSLKDPDTIMTPGNCEAINPGNPVGASVAWLVVLLVVAVGLVVLRYVKQRAAKSDPTVRNEAQARLTFWGFDPLAVYPGYVGFAWYAHSRFDGYADRLMWLALNGPERQPMQSELIQLEVPLAAQQYGGHPVEVNEVLAWFHRGAS